MFVEVAGSDRFGLMAPGIAQGLTEARAQDGGFLLGGHVCLPRAIRSVLHGVCPPSWSVSGGDSALPSMVADNAARWALLSEPEQSVGEHLHDGLGRHAVFGAGMAGEVGRLQR